MSVSANTTSADGLQQRFNGMQSTWVVPANPYDYMDTNADVYFIALQGNPNLGIIQPVLKWESVSNVWGWYTFSEYILAEANNGVDFQTAPQAAAASNTILGTMDIVAGDTGGQGDEWLIGTYNYATEAYSQILVLTGHSNAAFTTANLGVLEIHGLLSCPGLPTSPDVIFSLAALSQEGSGGWNDFVDVTGLIAPVPSANSAYPNCSWTAQAYESNGAWQAKLSWTY